MPRPIAPGDTVRIRYRIDVRIGPSAHLIIPSGTLAVLDTLDRGTARVRLDDGRIIPLRRSAVHHPED